MLKTRSTKPVETFGGIDIVYQQRFGHFFNADITN